MNAKTPHLEINYEDILNQLPILAYVQEPDGFTVKFFNNYWFSTMGITSKDVEHGWEHIVHPEDLERVKKELNKAFSEKKPYSIETRIFTAVSNEFRWFLSYCSPVFGLDNEVECWVGTSTDVHEAKLRAEILEHSLQRSVNFRLLRIKELEEALLEEKISDEL